MGAPTSTVFHGDCMSFMAQFPDKYFELAIVDPPYGIGISDNPVRQLHNKKKWDSETPKADYFNELRRCSKNQIIWGGNYFIDNLFSTQGFIVWHKRQPEKFSLAMCEFAWSSIQSPAKVYEKSVLAEINKIHPTQKPVTLYSWLLRNYAKKGDKILDTHMGSQSSRIAAWKLGFDYWGSELDEEYFQAGCNRFDKEAKQPMLIAC